MKCWVCKRQARGYGHTDGRFKPGDPRHYVLDWVFCSRRCQDAFHMLYGNWARVKDGRMDASEVAMIDPSDVELGAMKKCLKAFGEAAGEIGFDKPLGDYAEAEALRVIDAIVSRSGCTNLHSSISGNSGRQAGPRRLRREGVFDDQEISAPYAAHPQPGL